MCSNRCLSVLAHGEFMYIFTMKMYLQNVFNFSRSLVIYIFWIFKIIMNLCIIFMILSLLRCIIKPRDAIKGYNEF